MTIGIFGHGVVGSAQAAVLKHSKQFYYIHDPDLGCRIVQDTNGRFVGIDIAFICLPAPTFQNGLVDSSIIYETLEHLEDGATAIIRSTIPPGTTDMLEVCFSKLNLFFVPEFLSESTNIHDAMNPSRVIIGYSNKFAKQLETFLMGGDYPSHIVNPARYMSPCRELLWMPARDAEAAKYAANAFYANKVAIMNQFHDAFTAMGCNWDNIHAAIQADRWTGSQHTDINHKGYRGYAGHCLRKDTNALIAAAAAVDTPLTILEASASYNEALLKSQNK